MHRGDSVGWLICTILQGLLTWGFMGLSRLAEGWPWEPQTKTLVLVAIVATWVMALRTIRARIIELLRFWHASRKAGAEEAEGADEAQREREERRQQVRTAYVKKSMLQLRIIAAGITMPFFVLPAFVSALCVGMCLWKGKMDADFLGFALLLSVLAAIVGTYFHWAMVPLPTATSTRRVARERPVKALQGSRVE
jgi:hypothetical protein